MTGLWIVLLLALAGPVWAHGERHDGPHENLFAHDCIDKEVVPGMLGLGYLHNTCSYGVKVRYAIHADGIHNSCRPRTNDPLPCVHSLSPNSRQTAHVSNNAGDGRMKWIACRVENAVSDIQPQIVEMKPNGGFIYACYHVGFGPEGRFYGTTKRQPSPGQASPDASSEPGTMSDEEVQRMLDKLRRELERLKESGEWDPSLLQQ